MDVNSGTTSLGTQDIFCKLFTVFLYLTAWETTAQHCMIYFSRPWYWLVAKLWAASCWAFVYNLWSVLFSPTYSVLFCMLVGHFFRVILQGHLLDYCRSARSKESQNSRKSKSSSHHSGSRQSMMPADRPKQRRRKKSRIHDPLHKSRSRSSQRLPHGRCSRDRSRSPFVTSGSHRRCVFFRKWKFDASCSCPIYVCM